jgi:phosphate transport system permease protein
MTEAPPSPRSRSRRERFIEVAIQAGGLSVLLILFAIVGLVFTEALPIFRGGQVDQRIESAAEDEAAQDAWQPSPLALSPDLALFVGETRSEVFYRPHNRPILEIDHPEVSARAGRVVDETLAYLPLADGGQLRLEFSIPYPEVQVRDLLSWGTWQSGSVEPRTRSLLPLFFGSLKGAVAAMLVAVPTGLLAALGVALLLRGRIRRRVRAGIESLSAFPSTVLGLVAVLWFGPLLELHFAAILLTVPLTVVLLLICVPVLSLSWVQLHPRTATAVLLPLPICLLLLSWSISLGLEQWLFGGPLAAAYWIESTLGLDFQQRSALLVGLFLGLATVPLIFTLSESALVAVPQSLTAGAAALGATPVQVAMRIALPTAASGIIAAVLLAFGRTVGETMILVMASGNAGIISLSPFDGMRSAAASMAIELPEAAQGSALYHTIFLAAFLLFALTFLVNVAAAFFRARLLQRYRQLT